MKPIPSEGPERATALAEKAIRKWRKRERVAWKSAVWVITGVACPFVACSLALSGVIPDWAAKSLFAGFPVCVAIGLAEAQRLENALRDVDAAARRTFRGTRWQTAEGAAATFVGFDYRAAMMKLRFRNGDTETFELGEIAYLGGSSASA